MDVGHAISPLNSFLNLSMMKPYCLFPAPADSEMILAILPKNETANSLLKREEEMKLRSVYTRYSFYLFSDFLLVFLFLFNVLFSQCFHAFLSV